MLKSLMERCVSRDEASRMGKDALADKIITGEFSNDEC
jgi:hypothetical protein